MVTLVVLAMLAAAPAPRVGDAAAQAVLFDALPDPGAVERCSAATEPIPCLLRARFSKDPKAAALALELFQRTGSVAGVLPEEDFEGGYRGTIHLVPQLPVGAERVHLERVRAALFGFDDFFAALAKEAGTAPRYRWRALELRFFRSIKKRTPAAFALGWTVAYNTNGTLNGSERAVRDLLFHEIFHLNDRDHGLWSERALASTFDAIVARCGTKLACLAPYAPGWLVVRGGTYYAFMPGNGVQEYAAELSQAYLREQLESLAGRPPKRPFKCGPPENARAWKLLADEFFAGVDLVPACGK